MAEASADIYVAEAGTEFTFDGSTSYNPVVYPTQAGMV